MRPEDVACDLLLENDGHSLIWTPVANYVEGNLDVASAMIRHEHTLLRLWDGGAHYGMISDSGYPTFMLSYWARDRTADGFGLPEVVKALSANNAAAVGLRDRGQIRQGYKADLNVIDLDRLTLRAPTVVRDLPAGGARLMQAADGFDCTIVSGVVIGRHGAPTHALPGPLVRGARHAPRPA